MTPPKAVEISPGMDATIIANGVTVLPAAEAAKILEEESGLSIRVLNIHTVKPIDEQAIRKAVLDTRRIVVFEEHNVFGGLGSAVADVIAASGKGCAFSKVGFPDCYSEVGDPEDLYAHYKLDTNGILEKVCELMGKDFEADEDWEDEV